MEHPVSRDFPKTVKKVDNMAFSLFVTGKEQPDSRVQVSVRLALLFPGPGEEWAWASQRPPGLRQVRAYPGGPPVQAEYL